MKVHNLNDTCAQIHGPLVHFTKKKTTETEQKPTNCIDDSYVG